MAQYEIPSAITLARCNNIAKITGADTYTDAVLHVGGYTFQRTLAAGSAVFPLDDVLQLLTADGNAVVPISLFADSDQLVSTNIYVINGAGNVPVVESDDTPISWPQMSRIAVFPSFDYEEQVVINVYDGTNTIVAFVDVQTGQRLSVFRNVPLYSVPMSFFNTLDDGDRIIRVDYSLEIGKEKYGYMNVRVDHCDKGVFLRWYDAAGLLHHYLWKESSHKDSVSIEDTYETLSDDLVPKSNNILSSLTTWTLHSGVVDMGLFTLCSSILSGRNIQMFDPERNIWLDVQITDGDITRTNAPMQDCVVEVSMINKTL